ncbi:MAG: penicillin acylase family protein [Massilia sp.]
MKKRGLWLWSKRLLGWLMALVLLAALAIWLVLRGSLARLDGEVKVAGLHGEVRVARDAMGVPLISGGDRNDVAYATGFVHAQERFFQMDLLRRSGAGELAELFGERAVPLDQQHRLHRFRARAALSLQMMSPAERRFIDRYVAGINDGLNALAARPFEYLLINQKPRPWSAADSLLVVWAMYFDLQGMQETRELARGWLRDNSDAAQTAFLLPESSEWDTTLDALAPPAALAIPPNAPAWWGKHHAGAPVRTASANGTAADGGLRMASAGESWADSARATASVDASDAVGSNNWAVAGSRTSDGAAIVSDDMHLNLSLPNIWYRLALQFPDRGGTRRMVGVTLPGAPPLIIAGSNGHVAWGFTNSYSDLTDMVALGADAAHPGQVRTTAGWEKPTSHEETILVKGAPARKLVVRESSLGPLREVGASTYAVHWVAHLPQAINLRLGRMEVADTLTEALAVAASAGIPAQNFVAGDDHGDIGWTIAGALPQRVQTGIALSFPLDGAAPATTWSGLLPAADYPKLVNPANGQLSTANSRQLMGAGAQIIGDGGFDVGARHRQIHDNLLALGPKTDVKGVYGVTLDDRALFIAPWRARAIKALDAASRKGHPQREEFLRLLETGWTGRASVDSTGYRLARGFMWAVHDVLFEGADGELARLDAKASMTLVSSRWTVPVARLLDEQPAGWLPEDYASWQAVELAAIDRVIADLTRDGKPLAAATWGARNTSVIAHPISSAMPELLRWLGSPPDQLPGDANMPRVSGPKFGQSERMTVAPGKEEQGLFNMPGGQSGHPLSPYFLKGHAEWVAGRPLPLLPGAVVNTLRLVKQGE